MKTALIIAIIVWIFTWIAFGGAIVGFTSDVVIKASIAGVLVFLVMYFWKRKKSET
jgi:hypothetical protein